jgi:hypothetical protein
MLKHHLMSLEMNPKHFESSTYEYLSAYRLESAAFSSHQSYSACPPCSYYFGIRQCEVLSHCVKPRLHHVGSDAASVLRATLSSPSHTMSNFSQAGSSTTHTMCSTYAALRPTCMPRQRRVTATSQPRQTSSMLRHYLVTAKSIKLANFARNPTFRIQKQALSNLQSPLQSSYYHFA